MRQLKMGTSWVRGVVGDALTPELAVNLACAMGTWCESEPVVVGRDTRRSSVMLRSAVLSGLISAGCEAIDLGVAPTPLVSFAVREMGAAGGIVVTGSHNDARWNALKFLGPDGALLNAVKSEELLDIYHASAYERAPWDRLRRVAMAPGIEERYLEHLLACLDVEGIGAQRFRAAVDYCNGASPATARPFFEALGCKIVALNADPTGEFAHSPAPTATNMRQLATLIGSVDVDFGVALNVDGDRVGFVTQAGEPLSEEHTLPLAALSRLQRRPGLVVTNLSTSRMVDAVARIHGQQVLRAAVGEGYVMDRGLTENAVLAGEGSGGVGMLPATMTFDGLLTVGLVMEQMAREQKPLAELAARLPAHTMRKGELACAPDVVYRALEGYRKRFAGDLLDCSDGVRVEWPDAWLHARASNTEPLLRIIVEADRPERASELFDESMRYARRVAGGYGGN
ncbi:MAG TPA: phosphoglucosamine mutase [Chthonomonadales bacterium]|nr:phosphoglucosamine mutase [Chthonomonadales bacterium]